jgi:UDP-N-acetylmuramoylalanine--D-glutamate ligase
VKLSDLTGRRVGIWGLGREGHAALRLLAPIATVVVADDKELEAADTEMLNGQDIEHAVGTDGLTLLQKCDVVVRSPGVSVYRDDFRSLHAAGVQTTTGTDIWFAEHPDAFTIGVTGTKGKSTTSSLIAHLLNAQGKSVELAGNIGRPILDLMDATAEIHVFELSAQQIADLHHSPSVGVLTNLYREHLDWHLTEENYVRDKLNLLAHRPGMTAVLNALDPRQLDCAPAGVGVRWYGDERGFHLGEDAVVGKGVRYAATQTRLRGRHNLLNICAALTAVESAGGDPSACAEGLESFVPLRHRLEEIAVVDGVAFFNDSISTTPKATMAALEAFSGSPITLLLGGFERNQDYAELGTAIAADTDVHAVLTLPDNGARIYRELSGSRGSRDFVLEESDGVIPAVTRARELTPAGGVVLLSPAAPSFGHFKNFEQRGDVFADAVRALTRDAGHD